jgi:HEAT repeat protein
MPEEVFRNQTWEDVRHRLKNREIPTEEIGSAIVKLGKPFDRTKILAAKDTVALYLDHTDSWARHEAMWFLASWARLKEYQPALILALRTDPEPDNRSYAATCLGRVQEGTGDRDAIAALSGVVEDENEHQLVRLYAYEALHQVVEGSAGPNYSPHEHKLSDVNWAWVRSVSRATTNLSKGPASDQATEN